MRILVKYTFIFILLATLISSCHQMDKNIIERLNKWDSLLGKEPYAILDSLNAMNSNNFPNEWQAYHSLLLTIARDKTYFDFEDDKRISRTVRYYEAHHPGDEKLVRALMYQGIVRTRMGVSDSSVYIPLRRAETIFNEQKLSNPQLGYMLNYFIGDTYFNNDAPEAADKFYKKALEFALLNKDIVYVFDARMALFWNEMYRSKMNSAKLYLDSISDYYNELPEKKFFILNAQSYFYEKTGDNYKALECDKRQLDLLEGENTNADKSKLYYAISRKHLKLNQTDSAMYYGEAALSSINSHNKRDNFLLYENLANISEAQRNYKLANSYKTKALEDYKSTITERLSNQLLEVEKKYDLSIAENKLLKSRQKTIFWILATLAIAILFLITVYSSNRNNQIAKEKMMILRHEAESRNLEAKLMAEDANKMEWLISIYSYLSERLTNLQDSFSSLSQKYVSSNPKVYNNMNDILNNTSNDLKEMYNEIHPDDITFTQYTGINIKDAENFSNNEKMMLMLLVSKASNKQIATFMNSTVESVRTRKSQLKRKATNMGLDLGGFF